ncbi:Transport and Golgi organization protein 1 like protein [Dictyocoela muelleri]|nr:Transport and Golgi organization protein 1 like protein [Dictyocoela muelleri]
MNNQNKVEQIELQLTSLSKKIQSNLERFDEFIRSSREFIKNENETHKVESQKLEQKIEDLEIKKNLLKNEYKEINLIIESNRQEIISNIEESSKFEEHVSLLEQKISESKIRINELKKRLERLCDECERQEKVCKIKSKNVSELAMKYKKILGLDIIPIRKNIIKIEFNKICKKQAYAYFIIDFDEKQSISECYPGFDSLENINFIFQNNPDFYEFLIIIRSKICAFYC